MGKQLLWLDRIHSLAARFENYKNSAVHEPDRKLKTTRLHRILADVCAVVREAENANEAQPGVVIEAASSLLQTCLEYAYSNQAGLQAMNTFAHSDEFDEPWIDDVLENAGSDIVDEFIRLYSKSLKPGSPVPQLPAFARIRPWTKSPRPHALATPLSRFRPSIVPTATASTPLAHCIAEARAQLTTDLIPATYAIDIATSGDILALASGAGFKAREPTLQYYLLSNQADNCLEGVSMDPGMSSAPRFVVTQDEHKLVILANESMVRTFSFDAGEGGRVPKQLPAVHTFNCQTRHDGPIATLPNGRMAKAGKGEAAVWDISMTDAPAETRQAPTTTDHLEGKQPSIVAFVDDPAYAPATWHLHAPSGRLLCGEQAGYGCIALDVEHGGQRAARFLGHGGHVVRITTSPGDPNLFVTAASDGYARMFDMRRPLPVLTIETGIQREGCVDVVFVHPNGIPTLFTGGDRTQQIKMWDIREQECVYELSTGNNAVSAMVWDDVHTSLYVATTCPYTNKLGERTGYRKARVPTWATWASVEKNYKEYKATGSPIRAVKTSVPEVTVRDEDDERGYYDIESESEGGGDEDDEIDEAYSADMRWPNKCFHKENYFGYAYDAGENVLFRWHFKEEPDITQLPASTTSDW
ncbi:hypothetical protein C8Q77DRAFT_580545 [Trametes polyzona]|nr:hypothetical protein C8Q77DRAFT_580545 [Trametes polyzona]